MKKIGYSLIITGLFITLHGLHLIYQRYSPSYLAFSDFSQNHSVITTNKYPKSIRIPAIKIQIPIIPIKLQDGKWVTSAKGVTYLLNSPLPGSKGNSILYGHNWPTLLGQLHEVAIGDKVEVIFSTSEKKIFRVTGKALVTPDQSHVLAPSSDSRITLYTCAGFFDQKRLVVTAVLQGQLSAR